MKILVINGPNMNMLGIRQPEIYGHATYEDLKSMIAGEAERLGAEVSFFQSNHEGALVDAIQQAYFDRVDGIVINPAAYTHTSVALLDAVKAVGIPTVEVHVSDPDSREDFRHVSYIRAACIATIRGHGLPGYLEALRRRCDEVGALLVFDEIQTGMGRTGALFAMQRYGVTPDIVCLAKAFGGGMPLGAFVSSREIMEGLSHHPALGHITTFGGHPVCCAAGLAALEYLLENDVVAGVEAKGALYAELLGDHPAVREIRRSGLLLAVELGSSDKLFRIMELFGQAGILSDWFLFCDTAFRISPPLTITEEEVRDSAWLIRTCLDRL